MRSFAHHLRLAAQAAANELAEPYRRHERAALADELEDVVDRIFASLAEAGDSSSALRLTSMQTGSTLIRLQKELRR